MSRKSPPNFSFPARYPTPTPDSRQPHTITPRTPPAFGFPLHQLIRDPSPRPKSMPEITTPLAPLEKVEPLKESTFLKIPLEIRLQIYHYVLLDHPIHHAHLAPIAAPVNFSNLNTEQFHTTMFRPSAISLPSTSLSGDPITKSFIFTEATDNNHLDLEPTSRTVLTKRESGEPEPQMINSVFQISKPTTLATGITFPPRVQGKIPTALLRSCRQVFEEARGIPWEESTFVFINWFWSGVYAARQFTRALRPWQSDKLRYVGVEALGRDLWVNGMEKLGGEIGGGSSTGGVGGKEGKGVGEWRELCQLWCGVWGVRLGLKGSVFSDVKKEIDGSRIRSSEEPVTSSEKTCILDVEREWVVNGLLKLKSLRWIELEIEDEDVSRDAKLVFCSELQTSFNTTTRRSERKDGWEGDVKVIFVERAKEENKEVSNKEFEWFGGEPGNDSITGLDMLRTWAESMVDRVAVALFWSIFSPRDVFF